MIGRLQGTIVERDLGGSVLIDVQGVGYDVHVPEGTLGRLDRGPSDTVILHIHTHVREDTLTLYGFASLDDRAAFRALIGVSSIGPKLAIGVLSRMNAHDLAAAIARHDKAAFTGITGVGKKTVERLLVDLQGKLTFGQAVATGVRPKLVPGLETSAERTVVGALVQMGYRRGEAESAVGSAVIEANAEDAEQLLRAALSSLG